MPNHVRNIIEAPPRVLESMLALNDSGEQFVDFNKVVPQPEGIELGGCSGKHDPGVVCWYEWNTANWGTKWGGYDANLDNLEDGTLQFDTAWSHPYPVLKALSKQFPDDVIRVRYADEDLGNNLGEYVIEAGEFEWVHNENAQSEDENNEFAAQIQYGKSYAELRQEWDAEEIEGARRAAFAKRIEALRGVQNGRRIINEEGLEVPQDIIDSIQTLEQAEQSYEQDFTSV